MKKFLAVFLAMFVVIVLVFPSTITAASPAEYINIMARSAVSKTHNTLEMNVNCTSQQFTPLTGILCPVKNNGQRFAIVIGSNYSSLPDDTTLTPFIPPLSAYLNWAEDDALAMTGLFQGYGFDTIFPLVGAEANKANILEAINKTKQLAKNKDEVVFYFAGHGAQKSQSSNGRNWNVVSEGIVTDEGDTVDYLWDEDLANIFEDFKTQRIVFIFDSCLSGGMTELDGPGRLVLSATTREGVSIEDAASPGDIGFDHGLFTFFLLAALSGNAAQADGLVEVILSDYGISLPENPYEPAAGEPVSLEQAFDFSSWEIQAISPVVQYILMTTFGEDIASHWDTPIISDFFVGDLLL